MGADRIASLADELSTVVARLGGLRVMEVCGTHTVAFFRSGVRSLLPQGLKLISGPGCPVCVTPQGYLDAACSLAERPGLIVATYGDLVRVPGRHGSLAEARARGARVEVVYGARNAVELARRQPERQVVFLAVGFETTAPATAIALLEAQAEGLGNFSVLPAHKLVVPAMAALLAGGGTRLDGFLCPGHVSVVIGAEAYRPLVERFGAACVVAGFEAEGMLAGLLDLARMAADRRAGLGNAYPVAVRQAGNPEALALLDRVFVPGDAVWRALGTIPGSALELKPEFASFDARRRFAVACEEDVHPDGCRCGEVIQGRVEPPECPLFANGCDPGAPVGPCMVSSEGTCAAWYKYGRTAHA